MKSKHILTLTPVILSAVLSSCGGDSDTNVDSSNNNTITPTEPSTTLIFTINNISDKTLLGIGYYDENQSIQQLNFANQIGAFDSAEIQINATEICDYSIDFGITTIFPVYNLGGGNLFADILSSEQILFNCKESAPVIDISCNLVIDSNKSSGYDLACIDTFNNV